VRFVDRADAGRRLARRLEHLRGRNTVVLGLPLGGLVVAYEVSTALEAPLDVIVVRQLGLPYQPALAMGAIGEGGVTVTNPDVLGRAGLDPHEFRVVEKAERAELGRRLHRLRAGRGPVSLLGRTAVIVDDGIATGSTARAACQVARTRGATRVGLAVPVGPPGGPERLADVTDETVCLETPARFVSAGQWYDDFAPVTDALVIDLLRRAAARHSMRAHPAADGSWRSCLSGI